MPVVYADLEDLEGREGEEEQKGEGEVVSFVVKANPDLRCRS